jgi:hypothetical protein
MTTGTKQLVPVKPYIFLRGTEDECPICGGKMQGKHTCKQCISLYGNYATYAVKEIKEAQARAMAGFNRNAAAPAEIVFMMVAQVNINSGAKPYVPDMNDGRLWDWKSGTIGKLNTTFFGYDQSDLGTRQTALVILKKRKDDHGTKYYLNILKLELSSSDIEVVFNGEADPQFPSREVRFFYKGHNTVAKIGFRGC